MRRRGRGRSGTPEARQPEAQGAPAVRQSRTRLSRLPPQLTREADERPPVADPVLEIEDLRVRFHLHDHTVRAVDGVNIAVGRRETLGIVGESGCGKSVTSLAVMRLIPSPPGAIAGGSIRLQRRDLLRLDEQAMRGIRGNRISMIFQEPMTSLNPVFSVGYQIAEVLRLHRDMGKREAYAEAARLLAAVGVPDHEQRVHEYPFQLSGGLRQRVMIAMALACRPAVLIADEPTTALDVTIQAQILQLMGTLKEQFGSSIIFITHDLAVIAGFADRVAVMYAGVVVETAPVRDLFVAPAHPYTQGLLASVPTLTQPKYTRDGRRHLLEAIPGTLPDPRQPMTGCRFAERCPYVMDHCRDSEPALTQVAPDQYARCYLHSNAARVEPIADNGPRSAHLPVGGHRQ